jgi:hypothetical protein
MANRRNRIFTATVASAVFFLLSIGTGSALGAQELMSKKEGGEKSVAARLDELSREVDSLKQSLGDDYYATIGAVPGRNPRMKYYDVPDGFPKFDSRVRFIGDIRGTWSEMGRQYGERAGDLIRIVYTYDVDYFAGQKNMKADALVAVAHSYLDQIKAYAPEMLEFMSGIAEGAAQELASSTHAKDMSDFDKILLVNAYLDYDFFPPRSSVAGGAKVEGDADAASKAHCTGIALCGKPAGKLKSPTKDGETIVSINCDLGRFTPFCWNCAYVATPSDPKARVFWSIQPAGVIGGLNMCANDSGVVIGNFFGGQSEDDAYDFGVLASVLQTHAVAYSKTAKEARDSMVFGDSRYRATTARKKVLQTGLWGYMVTDPNEVSVLELTPSRHAIRYPGDMGESGNYVIYANWFGAKSYFDADNVRVNKPIGVLNPEFPERYWTYDWFAKYYTGQLDEALVQEGQKSTYYYDKETGKKIEFLEGSPYPLFMGMHTISAFWGAALGKDIGGTCHASQVVVQPNGRIKINWVQGRPSEWEGPWQWTDFYGYQK